MNYVDAIEKGEPPANPSRIIKASIEADKVPPPAGITPIPAAAAPVLPSSLPGLPTVPPKR